MTVKIAKFFSSSAGGTVPPPLPPPNPPAANATTQQQSYYQHAANQHHQQQPHYNHYMDDDDNMSMYSTTASIMTARDHPFNNSQRPLLAERKPQLLLKKKLQPQQHNQQQQHQQQQHQQQQHQQQQQQRNYISPYVQQQKRDSVKGLHGFNDFDILSQQYNNHLQSPHIGYPYGSPPSPTAHSSDFVFDACALKQHNNIGNNVTSTPRYGNISDITNTPTYRPYTNNEAQRYANSSTIISATGYMGKPSRFEDDFCCRRNVEFSKSAQEQQKQQLNGPFIFGIPPEQQSDLGRIPAGGRGFNDSLVDLNDADDDTVISTVGVKNDKYSGQATMQSTSDTSSSSRDSSSNKGAKFLLRKRKSKKNTKDKQTKAVKPTQPQQKPTIKCVVVGDGAVGKTNLILSYLENRFNPEHVPTASDIYNADVMVNDSPVNLTLCDTAGQDTLDPLRELCYPDCDVFLLCFSVARPETFQAIKNKWAPKFAKTKASLILVGTQADLRTNTNVLNKLQTNGEKPISYADASDLATTIGAKYIETSSATQDKVKEVFDTAIWDGLVPAALPPTPPLWKKLFCLA